MYEQTKKQYDNYIFDLYGTLIDIHTDEQDPFLWKSLANLYARAGADFSSAEEMHLSYEHICREKVREDCESRGTEFAEIDIGEVFRALYEQAPAHHAAVRSFNEQFLHMIAETFRAISIRRFALYPGTLPALQYLKESGARLFLLSNAQRLFSWSELEMTGLLTYFDEVYISSDYGIKKPEPAFMERLLQEQKLDRTKSVMVGNEIGSDIRIAQYCGMDSIYLNTGKYAVPQVRRDLSMLIEDNQLTNPPAPDVDIIWSGDLREICTS